ncbi:hypothetical protein NQ540_09340 [Granulicatella adiacens ATCC 49175]|jgi:hypothetical protein|uniref:DUF2974 domain-containing protein n=1 Tax=Granulicatella adiacens ATCC 49175 TaxID=638301 RepID=C8NIW0_9LACT|nr:YqiA/YcfP family alpha/beta fold hydrolase [Granulicatella adiacens]EEW36507.1 hypothetical protein HMPREF0444_1855 [Granulicatella adiacens ATCC 49175]UAK92935.1 hypothetical protein K8O88_05250 [Granulicatella adiacens]UWP38086.1 hypothetical protein NQ540_09340 [Granulicatella adiacens ATCC 49175]
MVTVVKTTGSMISTLDASNLSYELERVRVKSPNLTEVSKVLAAAQQEKKIPSNLEYIDDFYDAYTGTSGTAFKDKNTGKVVVSYTGTNPSGDFGMDISTDVYSIGFGIGYHYDNAYTFYEKMAEKYGADNLILTGHSLGGNVAQRVALKYNARMTIVYNPAPLYVKSIALKDDERVVNNIQDIEKEMESFTGRVLRINTEGDFLQHSALVGGVYLGEKFTLVNSGDHGLDSIVNDSAQVAELERILAIEFGMSSITDKKLQFIHSSREGISGVTKSQWIYLDALQAQVLSEGLVEVNNAAIESFKQSQAKGIQEANELYKELSKVPANYKLSAEEIMAVYYEQGVHYDSIVGDVEEYSNKKLQTAVEIAENFDTLRKVINDGIAELVEKDQELSTLFVKG